MNAIQRRRFLLSVAALTAAPAWVAAKPGPGGGSTILAAAWQAGAGHWVGTLKQDADGELQLAAALEVPTRAHGLLHEAGDTLLAVARRPGDWLLRWRRDGSVVAWGWIEPRRAFSGHALASVDGRTLYTTEADLDTGAGLIGVRDAATLEKRAEWSTLGVDAHALIRDETSEHGLIVANGGVLTAPETGRVKLNLARMDSSLVRLDARNGEPTGQWRLDDRRLSLRHLAWGEGASRPILGVALQAEHDDATARSTAPVLATFDGRVLRSVAAPLPLAGYGGDIAALGKLFAVSCPRAQGVALHGADGAWHGLVPLEAACALVTTSERIWAGGRYGALTWPADRRSAEPAPHTLAPGAVPDLRLDNHWIVT